MNSPAIMVVTPLRRLGAMLYDTLLVTAVLMVATVPFLPFANGKPLVPQEVGAVAYIYWIWEIAVTALYFVYFWSNKGRTVGMQAWYLRIEGVEGGRPSWQESIKRFVSAWLPWLPAFVAMTIAEHFMPALMPVGFALLALGFLNYFAAYWSADQRAWHERLLATRIVRVSRRSAASSK